VRGTDIPPPLHSLAVVVVNWNGRRLLDDCLGSLTASGYPGLRIVMVDNASRDDSVSFVRHRYPDVEIVVSAENRRWAGGNNLALRRLSGDGGSDWILLLNNDTIVPGGSLRRLVSAAAADPAVWAATPRICYASAPSRIWYDGGTVGRWTGWVRHDGIRQQAGSRPLQSRYVEYGTGCALLLSRRALRKTGELDEGFRLYGEDTDYCLRLRAAGGRILHVPAALVLHKVSQSLGGDTPGRIYLRSRSHVRLLRRHWHGRQRWTLWPSQLLYHGGHVAWRLWHGQFATALALLQGALDELLDRPYPGTGST